MLLGAVRPKTASTAYKPDWIEEEFRGMVAGIKAKVPGLKIDVLELKTLNTVPDWLAGVACHAHSCWGSFVTAPVCVARP